MTWAEFKQFVEARGVEDDDVVDYIDVQDRWGPEGPEVEFTWHPDGRHVRVWE